MREHPGDCCRKENVEYDAGPQPATEPAAVGGFLRPNGLLARVNQGVKICC
jgi:hypothetical protein